MTTPSMGTAAPVGSIVFSEPAAADRVQVGEVLVFHPPGHPHVTFVHRVISKANGPGGPMFHTRGDINGAPDGWTLTQANLIGRKAFVVPDLGFFVQMMPALFAGVFLVLFISHGTRPAVRTPVRVLAGCIVFCALLLHYKPLNRVDLIAQTSSGPVGHAAVVPTGVLPVRIHASGGAHTDVSPGQVGTVEVRSQAAGGFRIDARTHLSGWWWLLALTWAVPVLIAARAPSGRPSEVAC